MAIGQSLFINEFMASNDYAYADENGEFDDWFEIYNGGTSAIDIGGMYVSDALESPALWQIPTTTPELTTIPAGGFLVLWADDESGQGALHVSFKLGAGGEAVVLTATDGSTIIDSYVYGAQTTDVSFGRMPDGSENWQSFGEHSEMGYTCSPGRSNVTLRINEFLAKNDNVIQDEDGNYGDWIELYNFGEFDVDVTGMHMTDDFSVPGLYTFNSALVPAGGYLLIWCDNTSDDPITVPDTLHAGFKLSAGGDMVGLYLNTNTPIDSLTFGAQTADISYGRYPDGTENWQSFSLPTPNTSNQVGGGPNIYAVLTTPLFPEYTDDVLIVANVTTTNSLVSFSINYDPGENSYTTLPMYDDGSHNDGDAGDGVFAATIPPQPAGTVVKWYLSASDDAPSQSVYPAAAPGQPASYRVTDWTPVLVTNLAVREPSGLAFNANTGNLFTHNDDNNANIFKISSTGQVLDSLMVSGNDFEGIAFNASYDTLYTVEESAFIIAKYLLDGTRIGEIAVDHTPGLTDGLEGIVVDPTDGHIFVLQEKNPSQLVELSPAGTELNRFSLNFSDDVSGMTIHPVWNTLFIVSDQGYSLNEVTKTGEYLRSWQIPLDQVEGVAFGATDTILYMVSDRGGKFYEFAFEQELFVAPPALFINEFMAKNDSTITDENGAYDDWLEIYNGDIVAVDVGGMYLTKDLSQPTMWQIPDMFPDSTTIQPGDYLLLWCDEETNQGVLHLNFKLSAGGAQAGLYWDSNGMISEVDALTFGPQIGDISYGRLEDGGDLWGFFSGTTPGASNSGGVVGVDEYSVSLPSEHYLSQNYPNPFNPTTMISYTLSEPGYAELTIHNVLGQKVATLVESHLTSGIHNISWNGTNNEGQTVATGIYFYRMQVGNFSQTRKMMFIK